MTISNRVALLAVAAAAMMMPTVGSEVEVLPPRLSYIPDRGGFKPKGHKRVQFREKGGVRPAGSKLARKASEGKL